MRLAIIVPALNEPPHELNATVRSIREVAPEAELIVVDDCSSTPPELEDSSVGVIHNKNRVGGGASRHIGALHATGDWLFFTDSHVRLLDAAVLHATNLPTNTLWCGSCINIGETGETQAERYYGARLVVCNEKEPVRTRILTGKWRPEKKDDDGYELSCCMGACYLINRDFFLHLGGLSALNGFGSEEELLSMKVLLAGGQIRLVKSLQIGHRFRTKTKPPYRIETWSCYYNTLVVAHLCCPPEVAEELIKKLGKDQDVERAKIQVRMDWHSLAAERAYLERGVFKLDWRQYLGRIAAIDA